MWTRSPEESPAPVSRERATTTPGIDTEPGTRDNTARTPGTAITTTIPTENNAPGKAGAGPVEDVSTTTRNASDKAASGNMLTEDAHPIGKINISRPPQVMKAISGQAAWG